jgi:hypothetical protein
MEACIGINFEIINGASIELNTKSGTGINM